MEISFWTTLSLGKDRLSYSLFEISLPIRVCVRVCVCLCACVRARVCVCSCERTCMCLDGSLSKHYYVIEREKRVTVSKRYADLFCTLLHSDWFVFD